MKKLFFLLTGLGLAGFAAAQNETAFITKNFVGNAIEKVEAQTAGGYIQVMGAAAGETRVEVYVSLPNNKKAGKEVIQQRLDENYQLDISTDNHQLTVTAKPKKERITDNDALSISFKIYAPKNINTLLRTSGGSITIDNLAGNQDFATSGGSLRVSSVSGSIKGRTSGGSITLKNSKDDIDLATSGGSIVAENCNGNLNLKTSGGSLTFTALKGTVEAGTSGGSVKGGNVDGSLKAYTSGGSIHLTDLSGNVDASTSGGNMSVAINKLGQYVKLNNAAGNINLQLPGDKGLKLDIHASKITFNQLNNFSGKQDERNINGTINGGGTPVNIEASSGRVELSLK